MANISVSNTGPTLGGAFSQYDISTTTLIKSASGVLYRVSVTTAGTTTGAIYDTNATGSVGASNLVAVIPEAVGVYEFIWPCQTGIVVVPGTSQVISVAYE